MAIRYCEWIMPPSQSGRAETFCGAIFEDVSEIYSNDKFEYCPYCRGKIKINENEVESEDE